MREARYNVIVDAEDPAGAATFAKLVATLDWRLDPIATNAAPGDLSVLSLQRPLEPGDVTRGRTAIRELLGTDDLAGVGIKTEFATVRSDDANDPMSMLLAGGGDHLMTILEEAFSAPPPAKTDTPVEKAPAGDSNGGNGPQATIAAVETVLGDPEGLWKYVGTSKDALAKEQIQALYAHRADFARRSQWALAPELALLDLVTDSDRPTLAGQVLKVRANLTDDDERLRGSHADLAVQRVELQRKRVGLEGERVALAHEGVETAKEMRRHMVKWRRLAGLAPWFLGITTLFAMAAIGYMLIELLPDDDISDVAAPIAIFALAVFAISPAVLLLLERPLKGIDEWVPGAKAGGDKNGADAGSTGGSGSKAGSDSTTGSGPISPATAPAADPGSPS